MSDFHHAALPHVRLGIRVYGTETYESWQSSKNAFVHDVESL